MEMEVGGALASVLFAAFSLPCALLLLVLGEAGVRVASLALRGEMAWAWPTRAALLGYRIARPGGGGGSDVGGQAYAYPPVVPDDEEEPPLPAEYCDRLAVAVYRRGQEQGQGAADPDPDCAFCLSVVGDGEEVRELRCRHVFHRACLDAWLVRPRATCPLCRDRLLPADDYDHLSSPSSASAAAYAHGGALWYMT